MIKEGKLFYDYSIYWSKSLSLMQKHFPVNFFNSTLRKYWGSGLWNFPLLLLYVIIIFIIVILNIDYAFCAPQIEWYPSIPSSVGCKSCLDFQTAFQEELFSMPADFDSNTKTLAWESLYSPEDIPNKLVKLTNGFLTLDQTRDIAFEPKKALLAFLSPYVDLVNILEKIKELEEIGSLDEELAIALNESAESLMARVEAIKFIALLCTGFLPDSNNFREFILSLNLLTDLLNGRRFACIGLAGMPNSDQFILSFEGSVIKIAVSMLKAYSNPSLPPALNALHILRNNEEEEKKKEGLLNRIVMETIWDLIPDSSESQ